MSEEIIGYSSEDCEQQGLGKGHGNEEIDPRNAFQHDRDRVLYSGAFAALAGKTQVVPADELGGYHTRLTHSLKVAQIGRRTAEMLRARNGGNGPDPDLVEAACLAHDIGHPPFGHAGETALREKYAQLLPSNPGTPSINHDDPSPDGFEGNAQNFRILTYLSDRSVGSVKGLHLTRASLDATTKYPWRRAAEKKPTDKVDKTQKFGIYAEDEDTFNLVFGAGPHSLRPVEEQIMDWADDVTYVCHDLEDFFRVGFVPLTTIVDFGITKDGKLDVDVPSVELAYFLDYVIEKEKKRGEPESNVRELREIMRIFSNLLGGVLRPFRGAHGDRHALAAATKTLIR